MNLELYEQMQKSSEHQAHEIYEKEEKIYTFHFVSYEEVLNEINNLHIAKTIQQNDIPKKILEENSEVFTQYFHKNIFFVL